MTNSTDPYSPQPLARWFYAGAIASLAVMLVGCTMYLRHMTTDPQTLPNDVRAAFEAIPVWVNPANAVTVWVGLGATVLLLMRRRLAVPLMLVSLGGAIVWLGGLVLSPAMRDAMTQNDMALLLAIGAVIWTIFWFTRHSAQRGWLR